METLNLLISDETLRDGEQQVGLFFEDKTTLAKLIARTGVQQIALMPAIHASEASLVGDLVDSGLKQQIAASTMMRRSAIEHAKTCGVRQVILFHAVSDRLLFLRDSEIARNPAFKGKTVDDDIAFPVIRRSRQRMLAHALEHVRYAAEQGLKICFAAEDASRADSGFLVDCINTLSPYIDEFLLCDTVGILTPKRTTEWIQSLLKRTRAVPLSVHFHNDMGLALENTIQAVRAGAMGVSGTFGGIGERAGNAPIEQVLKGLRSRFGWEVTGIDYDALDRVVDYLHAHGHRPHAPYSSEAQRHESGIHVSALLRDRQSYSIFPHRQPEIWFGKGSGASNFRYLFEQYLDRPLPQCEYERLRAVVKAIAIQERRSFSAEETLTLLEQRRLLVSQKKLVVLNG
ncbi:LeuA family protein [cf. Phormidesmis sp. LEGE 11477]|uniref:LeuA family protein n=1 Tax=cf. Phormidesmis sp. LEGE 11477 TaxID=1828680 RepID=UPI001881AED6|nr:2-isopropylmalate synthase [cf. Phormidesmis sp. LEGE 11477]MBE9062909.1 2-isopropylmalate synthase [cf. Phormidesmis sp. LEGE 11477]